MAMQLSIDEKCRQGQCSFKDEARSEMTVWVITQIVAMTRCIGRGARLAFERIKSVQASGNKRRQMKLVESLALGNRRHLLLVVCDNQRYLVGAGADSVGSILAVDTSAASRDRTGRGPELVKHRGRDLHREARSKATAESGLDLWR